MSLLVSQRKLKNPPWPLDVEVELRMSRWKKARRGIISRGTYGTENYLFKMIDKPFSSYCLYAWVDEIHVTVNDEEWNCFE